MKERLKVQQGHNSEELEQDLVRNGEKDLEQNLVQDQVQSLEQIL